MSGDAVGLLLNHAVRAEAELPRTSHRLVGHTRKLVHCGLECLVESK